MPFKSKAQRRKFYALKAEGKMDQKTIDEWESETPDKLPERLKKPKKMVKKAFDEGIAHALEKCGLDWNWHSRVQSGDQAGTYDSKFIDDEDEAQEIDPESQEKRRKKKLRMIYGRQPILKGKQPVLGKERPHRPEPLAPAGSTESSASPSTDY